MNKKLIAAAVSAAVMAPVASHAEMTAYGRVANAYVIDGYKKAPAKTATDISGVSSRFGFKANTDIGNGLSTHGLLEFAAATDQAGQSGETRVGSVGLAGPFGRIDVGNQWSAYFNTFGSLVSPAYTVSGALYADGGGLYRTGNTIKYSNNFGPLHVEFDSRVNESGDGGQPADGMGLGLSLAVSDALTIAVASDTTEGEPATVGIPAVGSTPAVPGEAEGPATDLFGISGKLNMANGMAVRVGFQNKEVAANKITSAASKEIDTQFIYLGGSISDNTTWLVGVSELDDGTSSNSEASNEIWGLYHEVGGGLALFYEGSDREDETTNKAATATTLAIPKKDGTKHVVGMRINF